MADRRFGDESAWQKVARMSAVMVFAVVLLACVHRFYLPVAAWRRAPWYLYLAVAVVLAIAGVVVGVPPRGRAWFTPWWYRLGFKRRSMKLWGFCPACGYDLCAQRRAADGIVICPECGGAWRWTNRILARAKVRCGE